MNLKLLPLFQLMHIHTHFKPLKTKYRLFYLKSQSVPRSKHFLARL